MLEKVKSLPGAEQHGSIVDWNRQAGLGQRSFDMGGHVIWTFRGVAEPVHRWIIAGWHEAMEKLSQIALDIRISVFLNQ